jgi:hypothetical protein
MEEQEGSGRSLTSIPITGKRKRIPKDNQKIVKEVCDKFKELGWRHKFIDDYFRNFRDDVEFGSIQETIEYEVKSYAGVFYVNAKTKNHDKFEELLYNVGFKRSTVKRLCKVFEPLYDSSYTEEQLFDILIDYLLGKVDPITDKNTKYYISPTKVNEWFYDKKKGNGYVINYDKSMEMEPVIEDLKKIIAENNNHSEEEHTLFFHCTAWRHMTNIIKNGVNFMKGRWCLDFGKQPGFYVTKDIDMALDYVQKKWKSFNHEVGIVVFNVPTKELANYNLKMFPKANNEWVTLVQDSRQCKKDTDENELDLFDFVYGPVCLNPRSVIENNAKPVAYKNFFQLVSKNKNADILFRRSFVGSIWFRKSKHIQI